MSQSRNFAFGSMASPESFGEQVSAISASGLNPLHQTWVPRPMLDLASVAEDTDKALARMRAERTPEDAARIRRLQQIAKSRPTEEDYQKVKADIDARYAKLDNMIKTEADRNKGPILKFIERLTGK